MRRTGLLTATRPLVLKFGTENASTAGGTGVRLLVNNSARATDNGTLRRLRMRTPYSEGPYQIAIGSLDAGLFNFTVRAHTDWVYADTATGYVDVPVSMPYQTGDTLALWVGSATTMRIPYTSFGGATLYYSNNTLTMAPGVAYPLTAWAGGAVVAASAYA